MPGSFAVMFRFSVPATRAVFPVPLKLIVMERVPPPLSPISERLLPDWINKAWPVLDKESVRAAPDGESTTEVLPVICSWPIVCVMTLVIDLEPPPLITNISLADGAVRLGVQLVAVAQLPPPARFQVYVVCALAGIKPAQKSNAIISCFTADNFFNGSDIK